MPGYCLLLMNARMFSILIIILSGFLQVFAYWNHVPDRSQGCGDGRSGASRGPARHVRPNCPPGFGHSRFHHPSHILLHRLQDEPLPIYLRHL